jgi:AcrR family transcriptional regulator
MEKRTKKFEAIVSTAKLLFWKHGIRKVSIEEICTDAGVSRMTCYKYFNDKTAIAQFVIEDMFIDELQTYKKIMQTSSTYEEKVKEILELKMKNTYEMSQELLDDIYKYKDEKISEAFEKFKNKMVAVYLKDFRKAQKNGDIRAGVKPEFILYFLNQLPGIVSDKQLIELYPNPGSLIAEVFSFFFYGILTRKNVIN